MNSLLDSSESARFTERLRAVQPDSPAVWGKMDAAQMLAHCRTPLQLATGEVKLKRSLLGRLLGGLVKGKVVGPEPFKHDLPTDPRFRVADPRQFAEEHAAVLALVSKFSEAGLEGVTREPHPFFGSMSPAQWDTLMWKHLDHHLRQFGV